MWAAGKIDGNPQGERTMPTLLIVSCGDTDLQVAVRAGDGQEYRAAIEKDSMRAVHSALLDGRLPYGVAEEKAQLAPVRSQSIIWHGGQAMLTGRAESVGTPLSDQIALVPAKLAGIKRFLQGVHVPSAVVVFNTRRDNDKREPIADGPILSRWLAESFALQWRDEANVIASGHSGWVDYLDGSMPAHGSDGEGVNSEGMQRIDDTLSRLGDNFDKVYLATDGGMPRYREQIRAAARFRFPKSQFLEWINPERDASPRDVTRPILLPSDSYRARQQARELIRTGDFTGASLAVRQMAPYTGEYAWATPLGQTADYFDGRLEATDDLPDFLQDLIMPHMPRCLLPALRTEAALYAARWYDAVLATCSFGDAALIDHIGRLPFIEKMDPLTRTITCRNGAEPDLRLIQGKPGSRCLERIEEMTFEYYTGRYFDDTWTDVIGDSVNNLKAFNRKLRAGRPSPRHLRNILAHSSASEEQMADVRKIFVQAGLWAGSSREHGGHFLTHGVVPGILAKLSVARPTKLYARIVEGLVALMEGHRLTSRGS